MPRPLALLACIVLAASAAVAQDRVRFEVELGLWDQDVTGRIKIGEGGIGDTSDLVDDLALTGDAITDLRVTFRPSPRTKIRLTRLPLAYGGDAVLTRTIEFAGQVFTVATRVQSQLDVEYVRAGFAWQFLSSRDGRFRIGPLLEAKGFQGDASISAPDLGTPIEASESFEAAFGAAGLAVDFEASDRVQVYGEYSRLVGADVGDQTDLELGVRVAVWQKLWVQAGFRSIVIDVVDNDDAVDFDLDGIFFGAALRF